MLFVVVSPPLCCLSVCLSVVLFLCVFVVQALKAAAVEAEEFLQAKQYKDEITKLRQASEVEAKITKLEAEKRDAVDEEDFARAAELKREITALKAQIEQ